MTTTPEQNLTLLGLELPPASEPLAQYRPARLVGSTLYLSRHIPRNPDGSFILGRLGHDASTDDGYAAAPNVALQLLSVAKAMVGDLSRIEAEAGYHARSAVGMRSPPFGVVVEVEAILTVKPEGGN
jgi:enamine deaminase RidA (YjgF/YER057c/UK114 family)